MSLPATLLGWDDAGDQSGQSVRPAHHGAKADPPKIPKPVARTRKATAEHMLFRDHRANQKNSQRGAAGAEAGTPPSHGRVRSCLQFKPTYPRWPPIGAVGQENGDVPKSHIRRSYLLHRVRLAVTNRSGPTRLGTLASRRRCRKSSWVIDLWIYYISLDLMFLFIFQGYQLVSLELMA